LNAPVCLGVFSNIKVRASGYAGFVLHDHTPTPLLLFSIQLVTYTNCKAFSIISNCRMSFCVPF
jgi:hypothetical protein